MDEDPFAKNFKEFLDGLSPVTTMEERTASPPPPPPSNKPLYTKEELVYILAPSPSPQQPSQNRLYKKVQEQRRDGGGGGGRDEGGQHRGYSAHEMLRKMHENLKRVERPTPDKLKMKSIVDRLKINQEKDMKMVKVCSTQPVKRPEKIAIEKQKSVETRKSCDEERKNGNEEASPPKANKLKRRRRHRKMEMTVEEIRERKQLRIVRKDKLKQIAETEKKRIISGTETSQNNNDKNNNNNHNNNRENKKAGAQSTDKQLVVVIENRIISCVETKKDKAAQKKCHVAKDKADKTSEKKSDKSKEHRRPSVEKHAGKIDDRKRKSHDDDDKSAPKRRRSHEKSSPAKPPVQEVVISAPEPSFVPPPAAKTVQQQIVFSAPELPKRRKSHEKSSPVKPPVQQQIVISAPKPSFVPPPATKTVQQQQERQIVVSAPELPKRRKSHEKSSSVKPLVQQQVVISAPEPSLVPPLAAKTVQQQIVVSAPEPATPPPPVEVITIKEEIVDLTEESNSMCVNLKFPTANSTQHFALEMCLELPAVRPQTIIKQLVEDHLCEPATIATTATIGTQTTEFAHDMSSAIFARSVSGFVRDFSLLNKTFDNQKQQMIDDLEGDVRDDVLVEELREFTRHGQRRLSRIGDKLCAKLAKVRMPNLDFASLLASVSSHLAQATPSLLLTEHQIWQHLAAMLKSCCAESPSRTFVRFFKEALKPPDVFETPEVQFYKKEIGWGENTSFSFDSDTHEVPSLKVSIRAIPCRSPNQSHFFSASEDVIDLT